MTETTPDYAGLNLIAEAITEWFGERCPDYAEGCHSCEAWKEYDRLRTLLSNYKTAQANWELALESNAALEREREELKHDIERYVAISSEEATRAEAAEARVKELEALMHKAHAVMRECGWQLAISAEPQGDGILEAACTEVEADFADALSARALKENGNGE